MFYHPALYVHIPASGKERGVGWGLIFFFFFFKGTAWKLHLLLLISHWPGPDHMSTPLQARRAGKRSPQLNCHVLMEGKEDIENNQHSTMKAMQFFPHSLPPQNSVDIIVFWRLMP